jgi:arylsulfatase A-like enzyme/Tfp pilus assembly protein PilF
MFLRKLLPQALLVAGCCLPVLAAAPNVVLITIDTARADAMGFLGSKDGVTPNLDRLARQSIVFSRAYAQVPLTTPSHATILTGTYPQFNHLNDLGTSLAKNIPYLPDILRQRGYRTAAIVGSQVLDPRSAAVPGFERGFDTYDADFHSRQPGEDRYHSVERRASVVMDHAMAWLKQRPGGPFFLWVHLYDPHDPYDPPPPFNTRYAANPYHGELAYSDFAIGKLLTRLRAQALFDGTLIAVVADHGEAFGEHGERSHGFFLYDETVHVPLLIKLPRQYSAGTRIESRARLVDLAPTILLAVGIKIPGAMQGEPLLRLTKQGLVARQSANPSYAPPAYSETDYPHRAFGWSALYAWRAGKYLYIDAPQPELYDESADPAQVHNLAVISKAVADTMASQLQEFRRNTSGAKTTGPELNSEQLEQLQALGYVTSGFGHGSARGQDRGADPKLKIQIANWLHEALLSMEDDHFNDAIPRLEQVVKEEPTMPLANLELGRAWSSLGNYAKALPWLRKAVELNPESGRAHFELGMALAETNDWTGALPQVEAAVNRIPESDELHFDLATAYEHEGRLEDATHEFQSALRLNPEHYKANLMFGRLLGMHGDPGRALLYLQKAVKLQPESPDGHKFLANVYTELGQTENAQREQAEALRLTVPDKAK